MDLIPADYRRQLSLARSVRRSALSFGLLLLVAGGLYGALHYGVREDAKKIRALEVEKAISTQQRLVLEDLKAKDKRLASKLAILEHLRGGAAAQNMFVAIDQALDGHTVWFSEVSFRRAGQAVSRDADKPKPGSNYFILIPQGDGAKPTPAWQIKTHMEIKGQAMDHSALSAFVRRLLSQPEVGTVRVLSTKQRKYTQVAVIDFELAVVVNSSMGGA